MQINIKSKLKLSWNIYAFNNFANKVIKTLIKQNRLVSEKSSWWSFIYYWHQDKKSLICKFIAGCYRFQPITSYYAKKSKSTTVVWTYVDRIFVRALLFLIKPLFKHIISKRCMHLSGPSGVKKALDLASKAINSGKFRYFLRVDIKGYYASIDRKLLSKQTLEHFKDPIVVNYLNQIINIPVIKDGVVFNPSCGIHRSSSLSPFFGALYLSPVDRACENLTGTWYIRYMDDFLILTQTKSQFCKVKRKLRKNLDKLKLKISRSKTKMGLISYGFHFLGINFNAIQNIVNNSKPINIKDNKAVSTAASNTIQEAPIQKATIQKIEKITENNPAATSIKTINDVSINTNHKNLKNHKNSNNVSNDNNDKVNGLQVRDERATIKDSETQIHCLNKFHVEITLHERCCIRAMGRIAEMEEDAVHPVYIQQYLSRWAAWWSRTLPEINKKECLNRWLKRACDKKPSWAWLADGLLMSSRRAFRASVF